LKTRYIGLLRGINVGGNNRLSMDRLRAIFADCGAEPIATYIQSGNVIFEADAKLAKALPDRVAQGLEAELGVRIPVVLRSAAELRAVIAAHPFGDREVPEKFRSVMFLERKPTAARRKALDPDCSAGEEWELIGSEVHLCFPAGNARTKLSNAYFDRQLDTISTTRNWRTVTKLLELAEAR
jgi:uncharacterized protein (DUF1697 family)